jgi:hypothetical protein
MAHDGREFAAELESRLREVLPALRSAADEMGARSVSVFLVKNGRSIQNIYVWPDAGKNLAGALQLEEGLGDALRSTAGYAPESSRVARFLDTAFQPGGTSFRLFSWGTQRLNTTIAFGFTISPAPANLTSNIPCVVKLASVATWSVYEAGRLGSELAIVNDRLGKRKLVEQAKGFLQMEHGLDEQQAYEHLRRLSRQRRKRMSDVARDVLGTSHYP